jgi:hypothetical protein
MSLSYWIPLILAGICIPLFKLIPDMKSSDNNKRKHVLYQGALLAMFGIYLMITKMFLEPTLMIICWLIGALAVMGVMRKWKRS